MIVVVIVIILANRIVVIAWNRNRSNDAIFIKFIRACLHNPGYSCNINFIEYSYDRAGNFKVLSLTTTLHDMETRRIMHNIIFLVLIFRMLDCESPSHEMPQKLTTWRFLLDETGCSGNLW